MDRICHAYNLHRVCCCCSVLVNYVALDRKIKTCLLGWGWFFNLTLWSLLLLLYLEGWKIFDFPDDLYWNNVILMRYWFGIQIKYHPEYYCSLSDNLWHFFLVSTSFSTALVHKYSQNLLFCAIGAKTLSKSTFSTIPTKCMGNPFALLSHDVHMCARNKNPFHAKTLSTSEFFWWWKIPRCEWVRQNKNVLRASLDFNESVSLFHSHYSYCRFSEIICIYFVYVCDWIKRDIEREIYVSCEYNGIFEFVCISSVRSTTIVLMEWSLPSYFKYWCVCVCVCVVYNVLHVGLVKLLFNPFAIQIDSFLDCHELRTQHSHGIQSHGSPHNSDNLYAQQGRTSFKRTQTFQ